MGMNFDFIEQDGGYADANYGSTRLSKDYVRSVAPFSNGRSLVNLTSGESIFIDKSGNPAFPDRAFAYAGDFSEGLAVVLEYGYERETVIDTNGKTVFQLNPGDIAEPFSDGLSLLTTEDQNGNLLKYFIDKNGNKVSPDYQVAFSFSDGRAIVIDGDESIVIDTQFREIFRKEGSPNRGSYREGVMEFLVRDQNGQLVRRSFDRFGKEVFKK